MPDTLTERVVKLEQHAERSSERFASIEKKQDALNSIATSVAVMAEKVGTVSDKVDKIDCKVESLQQTPVNRWNGLVDKAIFAVVGGVIAWLLSMVLK